MKARHELLAEADDAEQRGKLHKAARLRRIAPLHPCTHPRAWTDHDHATDIGLLWYERCRCADCGDPISFAKYHPGVHRHDIERARPRNYAVGERRGQPIDTPLPRGNCSEHHGAAAWISTTEVWPPKETA